MSVRTSPIGHFVFPVIPSGSYKLTAQRQSFFPASFGQRRPTGQGTPIVVTPDSDLFAELHMRRMGAISGTVLDENGVGLGGVQVLAYRARLPLRQVSSATSDDRGAYRIGNLPGGKYWIRTAAAILEDGSGMLPTFSPLSEEIRNANVYEARPDSETIGADVKPFPGKLFKLSGRILCDRDPAPPVTVTVSSETGRRITQSGCNARYSVEGLAPGAYEVFAAYGDSSGAGFIEMSLGGDNDRGDVQLTDATRVDFDVRNAATKAPILNAMVLINGARDDLSGIDIPQRIRFPRGTLLPGYWLLNAELQDSLYAESIVSSSIEQRRPWRADRPQESFDVFIRPKNPTYLLIYVGEATKVSGSVTALGAAVPGAPVFLWPVAESARRTLGGVRQAISDTSGRFSFVGLPPGDYRILATFDLTDPELQDFDDAQVRTITLTKGQGATFDVPLWMAP
jgi:hypothetical protein